MPEQASRMQKYMADQQSQEAAEVQLTHVQKKENNGTSQIEGMGALKQRRPATPVLE
jgi:hypothetical protein